jgi:hypothetical protein
MSQLSSISTATVSGAILSFVFSLYKENFFLRRDVPADGLYPVGPGSSFRDGKAKKS